MRITDGLSPEKVFYYFEEISKIPRGSGNTKEISDYCVKFAESHGFKYLQDDSNNCIIFAPPVGCDKTEPILLAGHLDMVCEKAPDCTKDMEKEGVDLTVDGDNISAVGTTLGADDGIAVAMILALLDSDNKRPPVEAVFTTDEETGMDGAKNIDTSSLRGKMMINLDSEDEGVFTVSCAGGNRTRCILPVKREKYDGEAFKITVSGLKGGHSGAEIHRGRANADMLLGRILNYTLSVCDVRVISVDGGLKDNAIPTSAEAVVKTQESENLKKTVCEISEVIKNDYESVDGGIVIDIKEAFPKEEAADKDSTEKIAAMLSSLPCGLISMSRDIEGLPETSLNLGILKTEETEVSAEFCIRSSVLLKKEELKNRLALFMKAIGGTVVSFGDYPAWEYKKESRLRNVMTRVYTEMYKKEPIITAIHGGVECGLFSDKIDGLDCVSIGPNLKDIHTYHESMSISSVKRTWEFLLEVLKELASAS